MRIPRLALVAAFHLSAAAAGNAVGVFVPLGLLPGAGTSSRATALSSDGSVAFGRASGPASSSIFRWTQSGGIEPLGSGFGAPSAASADGSVAVGTETTLSGQEAYRWDQGIGFVGLGDLGGGSLRSTASGVSSDGTVVVGGASSDAGFEAFRWTEAGGMVGLGDLGGGAFGSSAEGVSGDGAVVVGSASADGTEEAFRWTEAGGMVGLGDLAGGIFLSVATDASADGSVVVGRGQSASGPEAFRWTDATGMVGLGSISTDSEANAVSADGSVIVGRAFAGDDIAFIWDPVHGMRSVRSALNEAGVSTGDWRLENAFGISADGRTIVGEGWYLPDGGGIFSHPRRAWLAVIPEPSSEFLLFAGLAAIGFWRRRRGAR